MAAFGVDAVFKSGSDLYNPDLDTEQEKVSFYNCSLISNATYDAADNDSSAMVSSLVYTYLAMYSHNRTLPLPTRFQALASVSNWSTVCCYLHKKSSNK